MLDEESFQALLAAAFTIQSYNDRHKGMDGISLVAPKENRPSVPDELCENCGASLPGAGMPCSSCGPEGLRPGDRLQRTWAALWSMHQEQGTQPGGDASDVADGSAARSGWAGAADRKVLAIDRETLQHKGRLNFWWKLRSHRADLYLGVAALVAILALLCPTGTTQIPQLRPWERVLVALGIADVSSPTISYSGDPNIKVWVDPHTALYYCPGDELYGKSPDGYYSTQHDAQLDRFEPAERSACVP